MSSSYYDHIRDIDMQDDNNCGGTFAEAFGCVELGVLCSILFEKARQKTPIKIRQSNIHQPETPSFLIFKSDFCQIFEQTSTIFLFFFWNFETSCFKIRVGANESFNLRYLTPWLEPWVSSYDPKHAIGSCLNPASIEISLAEIKSEPGEGQGLRIFRLGQFSL